MVLIVGGSGKDRWLMAGGGLDLTWVILFVLDRVAVGGWAVALGRGARGQVRCRSGLNFAKLNYITKL